MLHLYTGTSVGQANAILCTESVSCKQLTLCALISGIVGYTLFRETNNTKIKRALTIWHTAYSSLSQVKTLSDMQLFLQKHSFLEHDVAISHGELEARYMSSCKPWNWTDDMRDAYTKIKILDLLFEHKEIICAQQSLHEDEICKIARLTYGNKTCYALCECLEKLHQSINMIKNICIQDGYSFLSEVFVRLQKAHKTLAASEHYAYEKRCLSDACHKIMMARIEGTSQRLFRKC